MEYSHSESRRLIKAFYERFGPLPEGLSKHAANQGEFDRMLDGVKLSLETGKIVNWDDYVTPFPRRSTPLEKVS